MTTTMRLLAAAIAVSALATPALANQQACNMAAWKALSRSTQQETEAINTQTQVLRSGRFTEEMKAARMQSSAEAANATRTEIKQACKRGDMLSVPRGEGWLVKEMCDFGKAIVRDGSTIDCVVR